MTQLNALHWESVSGEDSYVATHSTGDTTSSFLLNRESVEEVNTFGIKEHEWSYGLSIESSAPTGSDRVTISSKELGNAKPLEQLFDLVSSNQKVEAVRRILGHLR